MTNEEKKELLNREMHELYSKQLDKARKQTFKDEIEAVEYTRKQDEEILEYLKKRSKELGIDDSTE